MTRLRRGARVAIAMAAAAVCVASPGLASMTTDQCIDANAKAQDLRRDHKLSVARTELQMCADPSCPPIVRADCIKRLDELESAEPTIAFEVKDASGADVSTVEVTVDGSPVPQRLNGAALWLDPGPHTATFEAPGFRPITRTLVLIEGQKSRRESVVLLPTAPPVMAPGGAGGAPSSSKWLGLITGGAGVAAIAVGGIFGGLTLSEKSAQIGACPSSVTCTAAGHATALGDHSTGITDSTVSTIAFITGAALVVGGAALFFTSRASEHPVAAAVSLVPSVGPVGGGVMLSAAF